MSHKKEIVTAVGTLAIAVGIGFVMQSSDVAKERYGQASTSSLALQTAAVPADLLLTQVNEDELLEVQDIELTSATETPPIPTPRTDSTVQRVSVPTSDVLSAPVEDTLPNVAECEATATASHVPGALVRLSLDAPCAANERLTVHHNGLIFTKATDENGKLSTMVPAFGEEAVFILAFANGDGAVAQVSVPDMDQYERVALQWRGDAGFQLHAREFGANYGDAGHVWSGSVVNVTGLQSGDNGFLMRIGDADVSDPLVAEVYTFASAMTARDGLIDMSVEAEITTANCGLEIEAQTLERDGLGAVKTRDLTLAVPGCDAVGDFLVLNNLVTDMKVAAN